MKWKFIGTERKFMCGQWLYPGNIIENNEKPNTWFVSIHGNDLPSIISTKIVHTRTKIVDKYDDLRRELKGYKMAELRQVGYKYDVRDTSKSELIEEIIQAKKQDIIRGD